MKVFSSVAAVLLAFGLGWWIGHTGSIDRAAAERLARLEQDVAALKRAPSGPAPPPPGPAPDIVHAVATEGAPARGATEAPVTIVEFGDFECDFCAGAVAALDALLREYEGQVRLVFKHNPLPQHVRAIGAHKAAIAAHEQGKFWEMHARIYASPGKLSSADLGAHAEAIGLDLKRFEESMTSPSTAQRLVADAAEARRLGVLGVPSYFVNGRYLGGVPYEVLREKVEEALREL